MPKKVKSGTRWTINQAAEELGFDEKTVRSRMVAAGHVVTARKSFSVKVFFESIQGAIEHERILDMRHNRAIKERKEAQQLGDLVNLAEALKLISETFVPIRAAFLSVSADCAARCNPDNPDLAREILEDWSADKLALVRKEIAE